MKNRSLIIPVLAACALISLSLPNRTSAEVSDDDFAKLKAMVEDLNTQVQTLKATHEQDQATIQKLEQKVGETQETAASAKQEATAATTAATAATAAAQATPAPAPEPTHDFMIVGDAEVQYGQVIHPNQHAAFTLANFPLPVV
jgi:competence protein ComGC